MTSPHHSTILSILLWFSISMLCIECSPVLLSSFLSALGGDDVTNGTSVLTALALEHLQHKADALAQLAEVLALGTNATEALFLN